MIVRAEHWERIVEIWDDAVVATPEGLRELCRDDSELLGEIESLLAHRSVDDPFSQAPAIVDLPCSLDPWCGRRLGAYELGECLGRGGMGTVYAARRVGADFEQKVAVKLIHHALLGTDHEARFRAERKILATLEHPNIARLITGGTADGSVPYVVMEHVSGVPLTAYCEREDSSLQQRLELFGKICHAVDYAHRHLVVHRDLKPQNLLVTPEGEPKLVDFGIAKCLDPDLAGDPTLPEARALTPNYASPEQLLGGRITTASDLYSLGVVLYELLTGQRPFDWQGSSLLEIERTLHEGGPTPPSRAAGGRSELRGDLDNIVLKALCAEPDERYASARQLAEDLERYRQGLPVSARPRTTAYVLRKWVGRNRLAAGALAGLVVALALFAITSWRQAQDLAQQVRQTEEERRGTEQVVTFLEGIFEIADSARGPVDRLLVRDVIDFHAKELRREPAEQPRHQARLLQALGRIYGRLGLYKEAVPLHEQALAHRMEHLGPEHPETGSSQQDLGYMLFLLEDTERAHELLAAALANQKGNGAREEEIALTLDRLGMNHQRMGHTALAAESFTESLTLRRQAFGDHHPLVSDSLHSLADLARIEGDLELAESRIRRALAITRATEEAATVGLAERLYLLGNIHFSRSELRAAERAFRESYEILLRRLGDEHPATVSMIGNLAAVQIGLGEYWEAEESYRKVLAIYRRVFGDVHSRSAVVMQNLGLALRWQGRFVEAEAQLRGALERRIETWGPEHPDTAITHCILAGALLEQGRTEEAEHEVGRAIAIQDRPGQKAPELPDSLSVSALVLADQDRWQQAEGTIGRAIELAREMHGDQHGITLVARRVQAELADANGRHLEALRLFRELVEPARDKLGTRHPHYGALLRKLARILLVTGHPEEAREQLDAAHEILGTTLPANHPERLLAESLEGLWMAEHGIASAEETLRNSYETLLANLGERARATRKARENLELANRG